MDTKYCSKNIPKTPGISHLVTKLILNEPPASQLEVAYQNSDRKLRFYCSLQQRDGRIIGGPFTTGCTVEFRGS